MNEQEKAWWHGFFLGMVWFGLGVNLIALVLILSVEFNNTDAHTALLTSAFASSFILVGSAVMLKVATKLN